MGSQASNILHGDRWWRQASFLIIKSPDKLTCCYIFLESVSNIFTAPREIFKDKGRCYLSKLTTKVLKIFHPVFHLDKEGGDYFHCNKIKSKHCRPVNLWHSQLTKLLHAKISYSTMLTKCKIEKDNYRPRSKGVLAPGVLAWQEVRAVVFRKA